MRHEEHILGWISSLSVITPLALDSDVGKREAKRTFLTNVPRNFVSMAFFYMGSHISLFVNTPFVEEFVSLCLHFLVDPSQAEKGSVANIFKLIKKKCALQSNKRKTGKSCTFSLEECVFVAITGSFMRWLLSQ